MKSGIHVSTIHGHLMEYTDKITRKLICTSIDNWAWCCTLFMIILDQRRRREI